MRLLRQVIKSVAAKAGYDVRVVGLMPLPEELPERECYARSAEPAVLYQPWLEPSFRESLRPEVLANTMLPAYKLYILKSLLEQCLLLPGDLFEAGTASGGSSLFMLDTLRKHGVHKRLWTLDTFEGYQGVDPKRDGSHHRDGDLRCASAEEVGKLLDAPGADVKVVAGRIPATLAQVTADALAFAHIDVNLADPTYHATRFCIERLTPGGIILFDDYNWPLTYGARHAIDKACRETGQHVVAIPASTQAFLVRNSAQVRREPATS
jgi:predicted O-methyltransferase YrrM